MSGASIGEPIEILLVEDNQGDIDLTRMALREAKVKNHVSAVRDGAAALDYLRRAPPHEDARRPDLILLDLNLPKLDGPEVLATVKADPALDSIPVIILTSFDADRDASAPYRQHVHGYLTKPLVVSRFIEFVQELEAKGGFAAGRNSPVEHLSSLFKATRG